MNEKELLLKLIEAGARKFNLEEGFNNRLNWFQGAVGDGEMTFEWDTDSEADIEFTIQVNTKGVGEADAEGNFDQYITTFELINTLVKPQDFYINYNTGAGNEWVTGTIEDAMKKADENATYTQETIAIENANHDELAHRSWHGTLEFIDGEENPIKFGDSGYYSDWYIVD